MRSGVLAAVLISLFSVEAFAGRDPAAAGRGIASPGPNEPITAKVTAGGQGLNLRADDGNNGPSHNVITILRPGSQVQLDNSWLLGALAGAGKAERENFFSQGACGIFGNAWKSVSSSIMVGGKRYHYVKVRYEVTDREGNAVLDQNGQPVVQTGFVSVEYLRADDLNCKDIFRSVIDHTLRTQTGCGADCLWEKENAVTLVRQWADIFAEITKNREDKDFLISKLREICEQLARDPLPEPVPVQAPAPEAPTPPVEPTPAPVEPTTPGEPGAVPEVPAEEAQPPVREPGAVPVRPAQDFQALTCGVDDQGLESVAELRARIQDLETRNGRASIEKAVAELTSQASASQLARMQTCGSGDSLCRLMKSWNDEESALRALAIHYDTGISLVSSEAGSVSRMSRSTVRLMDRTLRQFSSEHLRTVFEVSGGRTRYRVTQRDLPEDVKGTVSHMGIVLDNDLAFLLPGAKKSTGTLAVDARQWVVAHELAHELDTAIPEIGHTSGVIEPALSRSPEWKAISSSLKQRPWPWTKTIYCGQVPGVCEPNEVFAEMFTHYMYTPALLRSMSPEAYRFMRDRVFKGVEFDGFEKCPQGILK